jgi:hypothetical protein
MSFSIPAAMATDIYPEAQEPRGGLTGWLPQPGDTCSTAGIH